MCFKILWSCGYFPTPWIFFSDFCLNFLRGRYGIMSAWRLWCSLPQWLDFTLIHKIRDFIWRGGVGFHQLHTIGCYSRLPRYPSNSEGSPPKIPSTKVSQKSINFTENYLNVGAGSLICVRPWLDSNLLIKSGKDVIVCALT